MFSMQHIFSDYLHPHIYGALIAGEHPEFPVWRRRKRGREKEEEGAGRGRADITSALPSASSSSSCLVSTFHVEVVQSFQLALEEVLWVTLVEGSRRRQQKRRNRHPNNNNNTNHETGVNALVKEEKNTEDEKEEGIFSSASSSVPRSLSPQDFIICLSDWWGRGRDIGKASPSSSSSSSHTLHDPPPPPRDDDDEEEEEDHDRENETHRNITKLFVQLASTLLLFTSKYRYAVEHPVDASLPANEEKNTKEAEKEEEEEEDKKGKPSKSQASSPPSSSKELPFGVKGVAKAIAAAIFSLRHRCKEEASSGNRNKMTNHSTSATSDLGNVSPPLKGKPTSLTPVGEKHRRKEDGEDMLSHYLHLLWQYFFFLFTQQLLAVFSVTENLAWQMFSAECDKERSIFGATPPTAPPGTSGVILPSSPSSSSALSTTVAVSSAFSEEEEEEGGSNRTSANEEERHGKTTQKKEEEEDEAKEEGRHRLSFFSFLSLMASSSSSSTRVVPPPLVKKEDHLSLVASSTSSHSGGDAVFQGLSLPQQEALRVWGSSISPTFFSEVFAKSRTRRVVLLSRSVIPHHVLQAPDVTGAMVVVLSAFVDAWERQIALLPPGALSVDVGRRAYYFPSFEHERQETKGLSPFGEDWKQQFLHPSMRNIKKKTGGRDGGGGGGEPKEGHDLFTGEGSESSSSVEDVLQRLADLPKRYARDLARICGAGSVHIFLFISVLISIVRSRYSRFSSTSTPSLTPASSFLTYTGNMDDVEYQWRCFCPLGLLFLPPPTTTPFIDNHHHHRTSTRNTSPHPSTESCTSFPVREFYIPHLFHLITASHRLASSSVSSSPSSNTTSTSPPTTARAMTQPSSLKPVAPPAPKIHPLSTREARQELALLCLYCGLIDLPHALLIYHHSVEGPPPASSSPLKESAASSTSTRASPAPDSHPPALSADASLDRGGAGATATAASPLPASCWISPTAAMGQYTQLMNLAVRAADTQLNTNALLQDGGEGGMEDNSVKSGYGYGSSGALAFSRRTQGGGGSSNNHSGALSTSSSATTVSHRPLAHLLQDEERGKEEIAEEKAFLRSENKCEEGSRKYHEMVFPIAFPSPRQCLLPLPLPTTSTAATSSTSSSVTSTAPATSSFPAPEPTTLASCSTSRISSTTSSPFHPLNHPSNRTASTLGKGEEKESAKDSQEGKKRDAEARWRLSPVLFVLDLVASGMIGLATEAVIYLQHRLSLVPSPTPFSSISSLPLSNAPEDKKVQELLERCYHTPSADSSREGSGIRPSGSGGGSSGDNASSSTTTASNGKAGAECAGELLLFPPVNIFLVPQSVTAAVLSPCPSLHERHHHHQKPFSSPSLPSSGPFSHFPSVIAHHIDQYLSHWNREEAAIRLAARPLFSTTSGAVYPSAVGGMPHPIRRLEGGKGPSSMLQGQEEETASETFFSKEEENGWGGKSPRLCLRCWWEYTGRYQVVVVHRYLILLAQANCTLATEGFLCRLLDRLAQLCHSVYLLASVPTTSSRTHTMATNTNNRYDYYHVEVEEAATPADHCTLPDDGGATTTTTASSLSLQSSLPLARCPSSTSFSCSFIPFSVQQKMNILRHVFALSEWIVLHVVMPCLRVLPPSPILYDRLEALFSVWEKACMQGDGTALYGGDEPDDEDEESEEEKEEEGRGENGAGKGKTISSYPRQRPRPTLPRTPCIANYYIHIRQWVQHEDFSSVKLVGEPSRPLKKKKQQQNNSFISSYTNHDPSFLSTTSSSSLPHSSSFPNNEQGRGNGGEQEIVALSRHLLFYRRHPHEVLLFKDHQALLHQCLRRVNLQNTLYYRHLLTPVFYSEPLYVAEKLLQQAVGYRNDFLEVHRRLLMNGGAPPTMLTLLLHRGLHQLYGFAAEEQNVGNELSRTTHTARFLAVIARSCFSTPQARQAALRLLLRSVEHALRRYSRDAHVLALELLKAIFYEFLGVGLAHEEQYREEQRQALGAVPARFHPISPSLKEAAYVSSGTTSTTPTTGTVVGVEGAKEAVSRRPQQEEKRRRENAFPTRVSGVAVSMTTFFGSGRGESFRRSRWESQWSSASSNTPLDWYEANQCILHVLQEPCSVPIAKQDEEEEEEQSDSNKQNVLYDVWDTEEMEIEDVQCRGGKKPGSVVYGNGPTTTATARKTAGGDGVDESGEEYCTRGPPPSSSESSAGMTLGQQLLLHLCQRLASLHTLQADLEGPMEAVLLGNAKEQDTITDMIFVLDQLLLTVSFSSPLPSGCVSSSPHASSSCGSGEQLEEKEALSTSPIMPVVLSPTGVPSTSDLADAAIPLLALRLCQEAAPQRARLASPPLLPWSAVPTAVRDAPSSARTSSSEKKESPHPPNSEEETSRIRWKGKESLIGKTVEEMVDILQEQLSYFAMAHIWYDSAAYVEALKELEAYDQHWERRYPIASRTVTMMMTNAGNSNNNNSNKRWSLFEALKKILPEDIDQLPLHVEGGANRTTARTTTASTSLVAFLRGIEENFSECLYSFSSPSSVADAGASAAPTSLSPHSMHTEQTSCVFREKYFIDWCRGKVLAEQLAHRQLYEESTEARKHLWSLLEILFSQDSSSSSSMLSLPYPGAISLATDVLVPRLLWSMEDTLFVEFLLRWWWKESFSKPKKGWEGGENHTHSPNSMNNESSTGIPTSSSKNMIQICQHGVITLTFTMVSAIMTFFMGFSSSEVRRVGYFFATVMNLLHCYAWKEENDTDSADKEEEEEEEEKNHALGHPTQEGKGTADHKARPTFFSMLDYLDALPKKSTSFLRQSDIHTEADQHQQSSFYSALQPSQHNNLSNRTSSGKSIASSGSLPPLHATSTSQLCMVNGSISSSSNRVPVSSTSHHEEANNNNNNDDDGRAASRSVWTEKMFLKHFPNGPKFSSFSSLATTTTEVPPPPHRLSRTEGKDEATSSSSFTGLLGGSFPSYLPCKATTPTPPPPPALATTKQQEREGEWAFPLQCHIYVTNGLVQLLSSSHSPPHVHRNALLVLERLPLEDHFPMSISCIESLLLALRPFMVKTNPNAPSATAAVKRLLKNEEKRLHRRHAAESLVQQSIFAEMEEALYGKVWNMKGSDDVGGSAAAKDGATQGGGQGAAATATTPRHIPSITRVQEWLERTRRREAYAQERLADPDPPPLSKEQQQQSHQQKAHTLQDDEMELDSGGGSEKQQKRRLEEGFDEEEDEEKEVDSVLDISASSEEEDHPDGIGAEKIEEEEEGKEEGEKTRKSRSEEEEGCLSSISSSSSVSSRSASSASASSISHSKKISRNKEEEEEMIPDHPFPSSITAEEEYTASNSEDDEVEQQQGREEEEEKTHTTVVRVENRSSDQENPSPEEILEEEERDCENRRKASTIPQRRGRTTKRGRK